MYNYIVHASCRHQLIFELGSTSENVGIFVGPIVNRESYRDFNNKDMEHTTWRYGMIPVWWNITGIGI